MGKLFALWDKYREELTITRSTGQRIPIRNASILAGSHTVFGVETVANEIHVLTGPRHNRQPSRRVKFSESGVYRGSSAL